MGGSCWGGRRGSTADFNGKYVVWQTVGMSARVCVRVCAPAVDTTLLQAKWCHYIPTGKQG